MPLNELRSQVDYTLRVKVSHDGVVLGRGIAGLLQEAYGAKQGKVPPWVRELIAYYRGKRAP